MGWPVARSDIRGLTRNILGDTSTDVTQQDFADAVYNSEIDRAYRDVQLALEQQQGANEIAVNLVAGTSAYTVTLAGGYEVAQVRLSPLTTSGMVGGTVDRIMRQVTQEEGRTVMNAGEYATATPWTGLPYWWWIEPKLAANDTSEPASRVAVWPVPDATIVAGWRLTARLRGVAATLAQDTSVIVTPPGSDVAIANRVAAWLASWRGDRQLAAACEQDMGMAMTTLLASSGGAQDTANEACRDVYGVL